MDRKFFAALLLMILAALAVRAAEVDSISLYGRVKDAAFKRDLRQAKVMLYDAQGNLQISVDANKGVRWIANNEYDSLSVFWLTVPRVDSVYVFDVVCDGYKDQTVSFHLDKPGRREQYRDIPTIFMERAPRQLNEVTVVTSKIKFYNKGDTVVYNADAFELAEGSMLDALIAQLPGAELTSDGQIKVNGQFVESLLLNGKEFFDGNKNVMLENIGAYTVNNIKVYEGQTTEAKRKGDESAPKVLTMDVQLKKEYSTGWILNAQAGYGTSDRYLGRLFLSRFSSTSRMSLVANVNNLNDNRKPGKEDTWTPELLPDGTRRVVSLGLDYNFGNAEETKEATGNVTLERTVNDTRRTSSLINFLPGGDTYEQAYNDNRDRELSASALLHLWMKRQRMTYMTGLRGSYTDTKNAGSALSGSFNDDPGQITPEILDGLFSGSSSELESKVINRVKTLADTRRREWSADFFPYVGIKLPGNADDVGMQLQVLYNSTREELWNDYSVDYGATAAQTAERRRRFNDRTPNHRFLFTVQPNYSATLWEQHVGVLYAYTFIDRVRDSYSYALDRLNDMGIYGVLPAGYAETFDPANSYTSHTLQHSHAVMPYAYISHEYKNKGYLNVYIRPQFTLDNRYFTYVRDGETSRISPRYFTMNINSIYSAMVEYDFKKKEGEKFRYAHSLRYSFRCTPRLPELVDMVDAVNDADPMNIYLGNPSLKAENRFVHLLRWEFKPFTENLNNEFYLSYSHTSNALTRGFSYDTATGVRRNRMYNVDGNRSAAVTNELAWQFGKRKQWSLTSTTDASVTRLNDMIGVGLEEPEPTRVNNSEISQKLRLIWQIGGQMLKLRGDYTFRHTTSGQPGFNDLNAHHYNYGISGVFILPAGFGASTDFVCYARRGYGSPQLDTTDPVWNLRLTYTPPRSRHWVFIADGFDLLHRLSNVTYAVTAAGRTVAYTNALPRYFMLSVQYKLNIQPRK
ncbi:MAG: outer membrane beta-barrel family protein [Muribaculaceae bacterium]|nr:outer membrane beta-barrel family protein [Muribaculaceae bacterium]